MRLSLPHDPRLKAAAGVARRLHEAGFKRALVGGAVRDLLLGVLPHDLDFTTTATPEQLAELFPDAKLVGRSFGVTLIPADGFCFEVATAREERNYLDGRHPELVRYTSSLQVDVQRRDFTVNALMLDPETGEVTDCTGGLDDLQKGVIRTVGDPRRRFGEDYLRMLRAVRFAERLGFAIDPETAAAIRELAPLAARLSGERIRQEVEKMLTGPRPAEAVESLLELGLLGAVLPEIAALKGVEQPPEFHPEGDVFAHTMLMLRHMAYPDALLAWSVLLHDVGKPAAFFRSVEENGRIRFFNHESRGAELAAQVLDRLRFAAAEQETIVHAVQNHMRFSSVTSMRRSKLRRLLAEPGFALELELNRLDCIASNGLLDAFVTLLDAIPSEPAALPDPWVRGRDLVAAGITPSPRFKTVLERAFDRQLNGEFPDPASALRWAVNALSRRDGS